MDTNPSHLLRGRGRQQCPFTIAQIERKLADNEIGMLHEIQVDGEWLTLRSRLEQMDAERRAEAETARTEAQGASYRGSGADRPAQVEGGTGSAGASPAPDVRLGVSECIKRGWQLTIRTMEMISAFGKTNMTMDLFNYGCGHFIKCIKLAMPQARRRCARRRPWAPRWR